MTAMPKITTLFALAALALIAVGCGGATVSGKADALPEPAGATAEKKFARLDAKVGMLQGQLLGAMDSLDICLAVNLFAAIIEEFHQTVAAMKDDPGLTEQMVIAVTRKLNRSLKKTEVINHASEIIAMTMIENEEMHSTVYTMSERMLYIEDALAELRYRFRYAPDIGTFTDARDGRAYRTVKIGGQTWMAENLNFATEGSVCYDRVDSNCPKFGRLYNWDDAMKACPVGWRLPSDEDWDRLAVAAGAKHKKHYSSGDSYYWKGAGKKLKSEAGWQSDRDGSGGNGTNEFGFSARPGGAWHGDTFVEERKFGSWWSVREDSTNCAWKRSLGLNHDNPQGSANCAWQWGMDFYNDHLGRMNVPKEYLLSVRCVEGSVTSR